MLKNKLNLKIYSLSGNLHIKRRLLTLKQISKEKILSGLFLKLAGRLKGVERAQSHKYKKGVVKLNKITSTVQAKNFPVQTKWGKLGLKLWVGFH